MAQTRPPLAYLSEITPQPTLPAFAAYGDQIASATPQPKRFTADDWRDTGDLRGKLAGYGEKYLGMSPQQANTVFGAGADAPFLSLSDVTPGLDTALAINDAKLAYDRGDYLGMGLSALGAVPLAAVGYKLGKGAYKAGKAALSAADEVAPAAREVLPEAASRVTDISPRVTNRVQVGGEQNAIGLPPWRLPANAAAIGSLGVLGAGMAMPDEAQAGPLDKAGQAILRAFHSSPHKFDRFEWSPRTRGTGEGAASYGEGLYLAENPAVSGRGGQYWEQFSGRFKGPEGLATQTLKKHGLDRSEAADRLRKSIDAIEAEVKTGKFASNGQEMSQAYIFDQLGYIRQQREALKLLESGQHVGPHTYEVGIRARPEDLLDWDKPFKEQSPKVQSILRDDLYLGPTQNETGKDLYRQARSLYAPEDMGAVTASERLRDAGIPGHRFLDQGSRANANMNDIRGGLSMWETALRKTPNDEYARSQVELFRKQLADAEKPLTHNYVIWQPEILDILKRYGGVGAAPLAGLGAYGASRKEQPPQTY